MTCHLCETGFPQKNGIHYGTQRLGMIPDTPCTDHDPEDFWRLDVAIMTTLVEAKELLTCLDRLEFRSIDTETRHTLEWLRNATHRAIRAKEERS